jgi:hypothetical protein
MFSSSFTMSEQKHRQWTPYKHVVTELFPAGVVSATSTHNRSLLRTTLTI